MAVITDRRRRLLLLKKKLLLCKRSMLANKTRRRWGVHPLWRNRKEEGDFHTLMKAMREKDEAYFKKFTRMAPCTFDKLEALLHANLRKCSQREPLSPAHRLAITLRFLAIGNSFHSIAYSFRVGISTVLSVVRETCSTIWDTLQPVYMAVPTEEVWKEAAHGYGTIWQFPNCCGTVDGKHVLIQQPAKSGSLFYNYKGTNSIVLLAVVDPHYAFLAVDIGAYGSQSDGGIFKNSTIGKAMATNTLNLPADSLLPRSNIKVPHVFLGDEAFQLTPNFLRPFARDSLDNKKRVFNYRLSRARRCSENAFALLAARWRMYRRPILAKPENVDLFVKATVILHNFLCKEEQKLPDNYRFYSPAGYVDFMDTHGIHHRGTRETDMHNSAALVPMTASQGRKYSHEAAHVREAFSNYFMSPAGEVPWQWGLPGIKE